MLRRFRREDCLPGERKCYGTIRECKVAMERLENLRARACLDGRAVSLARHRRIRRAWRGSGKFVGRAGKQAGEQRASDVVVEPR